MTKPPHNFLFAELTADSLQPSKPFDGLVAVKTLDMSGKEVNVSDGELQAYLANTLAAIGATRSESGEIVGLPIDARGHDKGDGAGWIVGAELIDGILRLIPKWTDVGRDLISRGIRRFFSATIDIEQKVILGGTLTNWPAVRDPKGKMLLRPIELSSHLYRLAVLPSPAGDEDESLGDRMEDVRQAFYDSVAQPVIEAPHIIDIFDTYVIIRSGESLYQVNYTIDATTGDIVFDDQTAWIEVEQTYVEAMINRMRSWMGFRPNPVHSYKRISPKPKKNEDPMMIKLSDLSEADRAELVKLVTVQLKSSAQPPAAPALDLSKLFNLEGMSEKAKLELAAAMEAQAQTVQTQAQLQFAAQLNQLHRNNQVTELAQRLTGGAADSPRGYRGATADDLKAHLLKLDADEGKWWSDFLSANVKDGFVEFGERGHGKTLLHMTALPEVFKPLLKDWIAGKQSIAEFFAINARELGDMAQYNLSEFEVK